jgi:CheY-like chemotaxis protein
MVTGKNILIVENEGLIALAIAELLERMGFRVMETVYAGEYVLPLLEKSDKPDLILIDIGLAGSIDGIETARLIRQKFAIPLIFITAYRSEEIFDRLREFVLDQVIHKPFSNEDLLYQIDKAIGKETG